MTVAGIFIAPRAFFDGERGVDSAVAAGKPKDIMNLPWTFRVFCSMKLFFTAVRSVFMIFLGESLCL
jgi:hypothetical protein